MVSAGHLADVHRNGGQIYSRWRKPLNHKVDSAVYHIILDEWVFLPVHGLACESAAATPAHFAKRDGACPFCTHDQDIGRAADEAQFVGSV